MKKVKYDRIFRTLALVVILSLLVMAIPATPALAASATLSPTKGEIGDTVSVTGSSYTAAHKVYIYFSSQEVDKGDYIDDDLDVWEEVKTTYAQTLTDPDPGDIDASFKVPDELTDGYEDEDVHGGEYFVYTTESKEDKILTKDEFTVIGITISPTEGPVGTRVEIDGIGYDDDYSIYIEYDSDDIDIASGEDETDSHGEFTCKIDIPESTAGEHTITAKVHGDEGEAVFTVEPAMTISPTSGIIGDNVTVTGTGFGDEVDVTVTFDSNTVVTDETDGDGSFEAAFNVPSVGPGTYDVEAEDEDDNSAEAEFKITTDLAISPVTSATSPGYVGKEMTISGTGFRASHEITITYASTPVTFTTTSKADGSFSYTFTAPASAGGEHTITATDGTSSMEVTFYMESTPPQIPPPLLPYMDSKAKSMASFDWEDVDDLSKPVTYTLQIATDENFTSMVLEKAGLTTSEYTLTEEEALESTTKEAPYYWRIRAVDAASNASGWTSAGTFYVGFIFELKGWILYTIMGVGGLLLLFIGFWVGRRSGGGAGEY